MGMTHTSLHTGRPVPPISVPPISVPPISVPPTSLREPGGGGRARVALQPPSGVVGKLLTWYAKRRFGQVPENMLALAPNPRVLRSQVRHEMSVARWNALDPQLKSLAEMAAASAIECSWCMDFGYYLAHSAGLDLVKISAVPTWRSSTVFTDLERGVLEFAEAMTATPPTVSDELVDALGEELGDAALVELTMMVAVENLRSRVNAALGLSSQGFSDACRVPLRPVPTDAAEPGRRPDAGSDRGRDLP